MARPRYALAKQRAERLLQETGISEPPVDVMAVADECGAEVLLEQFDDLDDDQLKNAAAVLIRQSGEPPVIGVNKDHPVNRRRFSIAHELGHLLMHNDEFHVDTSLFMRNVNSSTAESVMEIEANQFAANLLMPSFMLERDLKGQDVDIDETAVDLAERYGVSLQAMTLRIAKFLKYGL